MQGAPYPGPNADAEAFARAKNQRQQNLKERVMRDKVEDLRMSEREVDEAIRVTEEKLGILKRTMAEGKGIENGVEGFSQRKSDDSE